MDEYKRRRRRSRAVMSMFLDSLGGSIDNVDVATFDSDGTDLKALVVGIEPIQDLHGYDSPWPPGGGNNLLDVSNATHSTYNIGSIPNTLLPNTEYTYSINGTTTARYRLYLAKSSVPLSAAIPLSNNYDTSGEHETFTTPADMSEYDALVLAGNSSGAGSVPLSDILPQIEIGSSATSYAPYSNICPISGHSSVNVIVSPTLNPLDGTITNIPLGGTYYGGQLDVLTGVLTVTNVNIASYNGEAINEPWISSMDAYSPGATPTTGAQVVYPLATPQTIQLTGQQIATFLGTNNVWCDSGKIIHLEY